MPTARPRTARTTVAELLDTLDHPHLAEIRALRAVILGADARIAEEVKWNAPSFRTTDHFATVHLRARDGVQLILHLGARSRPDAAVRAEVADPTAMLRWLAADRASVTFRDLEDVEARRDALAEVVRQWIRHL